MEWSPLLRGNADSSFNRDLAVLVLAFRHLKPTATAWPGGEEEGHPRWKKRLDGPTIVVLRDAWFGRAEFIAPALIPRLGGAGFEARAADVAEDARGLPGKTGGAQ